MPVRSAPPREDERRARPRADGPPPARSAPSDHLAIVRRTVAAALEVREEVVGVDVALVELGADSLVLTRVISQLDRWFGVRPSSRSLFDELNTVRRIADHVAARSPAQTAATDEPRPADPLPARGAAAPAAADPRPRTAARPAQTALDQRQREHLQDLLPALCCPDQALARRSQPLETLPRRYPAFCELPDVDEGDGLSYRR
ncbi:MAG: acyl carrier protein [Minicystis sp.]